MKIAADWMRRPETSRVIAALQGGGYRALFVGGCVRNAILGEPVTDIDLATDAPPEMVTALAEKAGMRVAPTGIAHGTVTVISGGIPHEVTTFRRDVETFGRHATVAFSTRIEDDAWRRDFTMNALYAEADGAVIDPVGGLSDLTARRVVFVGEAEARIREDYLRILRFFRFHAWYGDAEAGLDSEGLAACVALSAGIDTLSRERVGAEMRKLLSAADPAPSVAAMQATGVLGQVLPGADAKMLPVLVHLEAGRPAGWIARLAVIGGEDADERMRLSRDEAKRLLAVRSGMALTAGPGEIGYRFGAETGRAVLLARAASLGAAAGDMDEAELARGAAARFPLRAADLMPRYSGPALGARLAELESRWIASGFQLGRDALLA